MMASHRPSDPPPDPLPEPITETPTMPGGLPPTRQPTLQPSSFLAGFDHVLAIGVLALGFLLASFTVKNSDFFLNLAVGRLITEGNYSFGKDPFSYVGADRVWVNHAWLFDVGLYLLYKIGSGAGVVIAKALAVALIAGLLMLARRPGHALWPGVVCVGLALLAAAPRLNVQPMMASYLFFSVLLFLLMRLPRPEGSWRFPIAIGVLFWLWANCDQWFFVGPLSLLLYSVGQYIRKDVGENLNALWKALGIGVVACMLNPHHVRVWTLPPELIDTQLAQVVADDSEYGPMFHHVWTKGAVDFSLGAEAGNPANTYALALVILLTVVSFALNYRQLSVGLVLVWVASLILWALHPRSAPFLAFASGALAGANFAAFGQQLIGRTYGDGTERVLHMLRSMGRGMTLLVGLFLIALSYAGWLHPLNQQRRWKWDVEPNTSMVNAAKQLQEWRTSGALPPEAHMLNIQPDFANYVAWYAPGEKSFCDFRFGFHAPEMEDYVQLRKYLGPGMDSAKKARLNFDFPAFLRKHGIAYAVTAHPSRSRNMSVLLALWTTSSTAKGEPDWSILHIDGRAVILGWELQTIMPPDKLNALRFDPVKLAYADVTPLKRIEEYKQPFAERDIWDRYVAPPPPLPSAGEEVIIIQDYRERLIRRTEQAIIEEVQPKVFKALGTFAFANLYMGAKLGAPLPAMNAFVSLRPEAIVAMYVNQTLDSRLPPEVKALSLLAVRAARRAILESPQHPDGYYFLSKAYQMMVPSDITGLASSVGTVNLARHIARIPVSPEQRRSTLPVFLNAYDLQRQHSMDQPPRMDMALAATRVTERYLGYELSLREAEKDRSSDLELRETEGMDKQLKMLQKNLPLAEDEIQKRRDQFINDAARTSVAVERAAIARRYGLAQEALDELLKEMERLGKNQASGTANFTPKERAEMFATYSDVVELLLYAGRVEDALDVLEIFDSPNVMTELQGDMLRQNYLGVRFNILQKLYPRVPPYELQGQLSGFDRNRSWSKV
jgi:hypothetical protein